MKLANTLPISRNFSEQNPVIGLSFSVGYNKLLLFVGETIIVTLNNVIGGDNVKTMHVCSPPHILQAYGGLRRGEGTIRHAYTPKERSVLLKPEQSKPGYLDHPPQERILYYHGVTGCVVTSEEYFKMMLEERRQAKCNNFQYEPKRKGFLNRTIQTLALTTNGFLDLTWFRYLKETTMGGEQVNPTIRKLLRNAHSGVPDSNVSFYSSFSGRGIPEPVLYSKAAHFNRQSCEEAMVFLNKGYFFTAEGMVHKVNDPRLN